MTESPIKKRNKPASELEVFDELFPVLVDDLTKHGLKDNEISSAMEYFREVKTCHLLILLPVIQSSKKCHWSYPEVAAQSCHRMLHPILKSGPIPLQS